MQHYKDRLRLVWLFDKPYYWTVTDGQLCLKPARVS